MVFLGKTVILTGNGLSVGLNSAFSLPNITKRFYEHLEPEHKSFIAHHMERLEKGDYIQTDFEEAISSIEQVYDSLKSYYDFLKSNEFGDKFLEAYSLEKEELQKHLSSVRSIILRYTTSIIDLIDGHVKWDEINSKLPNFIQWLTDTIDNAEEVDLFTLNFDLLLETILLETIGPKQFIDFHPRSENWELLDGDDKRFAFSPDLAKQIHPDRKVRLHHLHGSLSSFRDIYSGKIFKITTESLRQNKIYEKIFDHDITPSIVTGGGKSVKVQENPFNFYYNEFKRKLGDENNCCENLYIIGYSFRDDHINKALKRRLSFERKKENTKLLNEIKIVDFQTSDEGKKEFVNRINEELELGPRTKNRFVMDDPRIIFTGANDIG